MRCTLALILAITATVTWTSQSQAQLTPTDASHMGLEDAWSTQLQMPSDGRGLVSSDLWIDSSKTTQYAVVELTDRTIRIAADLPDRRGNPIGIEEAKKLAGSQAARLLGKPDGFEVVEVSVPDIKLVLVSANGLVQTLDAETGKLLWSSVCGSTRAPAHPAAVSPLGISVIHGEHLYLLDWTTGKHVNVQRLRFATSNAVAICKDLAFVSDFTGRVEAYGLNKRIPPWGYLIRGRAVGSPATFSDQSFSGFATDQGYVFVFGAGETPEIWIRFQAASPILGSMVAANKSFYVGDSNGTLTKFNTDDRSGRVIWEFTTGQTISEPALVVGKDVFLATEAGELVAIDDASGLANWQISQRTRSVIGRAGGKVFFTTASGQVGAADAASGRLVGLSSPMNMGAALPNKISDRIYIASASGRVQCLRPIGEVLPNFIVPPPTTPATTETDEGVTAPEMPTESASNPFEGFGAGAPASEANPFGGDDPFGGGAGGNAGADPDGMDNPFDNPFDN
ncbi:MAG: PQQ-binding-like beta-propeller repeat protein [Pirellulaceae bacterium]